MTTAAVDMMRHGTMQTSVYSDGRMLDHVLGAESAVSFEDRCVLNCVTGHTCGHVSVNGSGYRGQPCDHRGYYRTPIVRHTALWLLNAGERPVRSILPRSTGSAIGILIRYGVVQLHGGVFVGDAASSADGSPSYSPQAGAVVNARWPSRRLCIETGNPAIADTFSIVAGIPKCGQLRPAFSMRGGA